MSLIFSLLVCSLNMMLPLSTTENRNQSSREVMWNLKTKFEHILCAGESVKDSKCRVLLHFQESCSSNNTREESSSETVTDMPGHKAVKVIPAGCLEEPVFLNQGAVKKRKTHKPGYPVVIEYECGRQGHEIYKYVTGTTEALCDENGRWTLPALICIPTNCFVKVINRQGGTKAWYAGNMTKSGRKRCRKWTDFYPIGQPSKFHGATLFPGDTNISVAGSKCRDPYNSGKPWCYTGSWPRRKRDCHVLKCDLVFKCGIPPYVPGARPVTMEVVKEDIHVIYECHDNFTYLSGSTKATCKGTSGTWTWPSIFCYSTECYYVDVETKKAVYKGNVSITKSGKTCQRFDSQHPHTHTNVQIDLYPAETSFEEIGNKCRDPDSGGFPWCYTTDFIPRWEICDVPECVFNS